MVWDRKQPDTAYDEDEESIASIIARKDKSIGEMGAAMAAQADRVRQLKKEMSKMEQKHEEEMGAVGGLLKFMQEEPDLLTKIVQLGEFVKQAFPLADPTAQVTLPPQQPKKILLTDQTDAQVQQKQEKTFKQVASPFDQPSSSQQTKLRKQFDLTQPDLSGNDEKTKSQEQVHDISKVKTGQGKQKLQVSMEQDGTSLPSWVKIKQEPDSSKRSAAKSPPHASKRRKAGTPSLSDASKTTKGPEGVANTRCARCGQAKTATKSEEVQHLCSKHHSCALHWTGHFLLIRTWTIMYDEQLTSYPTPEQIFFENGVLVSIPDWGTISRCPVCSQVDKQVPRPQRLEKKALVGALQHSYQLLLKKADKKLYDTLGDRKLLTQSSTSFEDLVS